MNLRMNLLHRFAAQLIFFTGALLINVLIIICIMGITNERPPEKAAIPSNSVFLAEHIPVATPRIKKVEKQLQKNEVKPRKFLKKKLKKIKNIRKKPEVKIKTPIFDVAINPILKNNLIITQLPEPAAPPIEKTSFKEPVVEPETIEEVSAVQAVSKPRVHQTEFQMGEVDQVPKIVKKVEPVYPRRARRRNIQGKVMIKFLVNSHGRVEKPVIQESKPKGIFDQSVLSAVKKWRFTPGYYEGRPVATWVICPIRFNLNG